MEASLHPHSVADQSSPGPPSAKWTAADGVDWNTRAPSTDGAVRRPLAWLKNEHVFIIPTEMPEKFLSGEGSQLPAGSAGAGG